MAKVLPSEASLLSHSFGRFLHLGEDSPPFLLSLLCGRRDSGFLVLSANTLGLPLSYLVLGLLSASLSYFLGS